MKDYIQTTQILSVPQEIVQLSFQVSENTKEISDIKEKMLTKDDLTKVIQSFSLPEKGIEYVIYSGKTFEADSAYADIYSKAKRKIYHCGASSKDAGNKITTISKSDNKELYHPMVDDLLLQPALQLR